MGNNKHKDKTRRGFLSLLLSGKNNNLSETEGKSETVKMLTADGKLVEIDRSILEQASKKQKSTNKEIFDWMKNPSKDQS